MSLQADLLTLSMRSTQMVAAHAGHMIQLEEPDLVIHAIMSVLREAQAGVQRLH